MLFSLSAEVAVEAGLLSQSRPLAALLMESGIGSCWSFGRKQTGFNQQKPHCHGFRFINVEDGNGRSADRGAAHKDSTIPAKMSAPFVAPRVEEWRGFSGLRVSTGDICTLKRITIKTTYREVPRNSSSVMLLGDDMIDFKPQQAVILVQLAIFAAVLGSLPDLFPQFFVHDFRRRNRVF
jgi:hypothetical protein